MEQDEKREQVIQGLANLMRTSSFNVEYKVVKKPKGINVVIEVTQEQMNGIMEATKKKVN